MVLKEVNEWCLCNLGNGLERTVLENVFDEYNEGLDMWCHLKKPQVSPSLLPLNTNHSRDGHESNWFTHLLPTTENIYGATMLDIM